MGSSQRTAQSPPGGAEWALPAEPATVTSLRSAVRSFARDRGADESVVVDLALAVTEAVTNAVLHAFLDREPGTVYVTAHAGADELVVTVADDGRGMLPRTDSPGLGLGLPTIGRLASHFDVRERPGGGTELAMTFDAPGVAGPELGRGPDADLLEAVARTAQGAWPGEGVGRLVDLLVPALADACAVDVIDADGEPQRFAGRIDGPDAARRSTWLATLRPRTDAPRSATRAALDQGGIRISELTPELIAALTATDADAAEMAATGIHWWVVVPLREGGRLLGLLHFGMRAARGRPDAKRIDRFDQVARRAAGALANAQLVIELSRTRRRFERVLDVLEEPFTVSDADGRVLYANEAAVRLLGAGSRKALLDTDADVLERRFTRVRELRRAVLEDDLGPLTVTILGAAPPD